MKIIAIVPMKLNNRRFSGKNTRAFTNGNPLGFKEIFLLGFDHSFKTEVDMNGKKKINNVKNHFDKYGNENVVARKDAMTMCYKMCKEYTDVTRGGEKIGGCFEK